MKIKKFLIILAILSISAGCAGLEDSKRIAHAGLFFSRNNPKIELKIDTSFEHLGDINETESLQYDDGGGSSGSERNEAFIFGKKGNNNELSKGVVIIINQLNRGFYYDDLFNWVPSEVQLVSKIKKINGNTYQQCIFPATFFFQTKLRDIVYDNGYIIPNCFLINGIARNFSANGNKVIFIYYFEDISNFGTPIKYNCSEWIGINNLKKDQQKRLEELITATWANIEYVK